MTLTQDPKSVFIENESVLENNKSILDNTQSVSTPTESVFAKVKISNLFWFTIQLIFVVLVGDKVANISENPLWQTVIFGVSLCSYPIYLLADKAKQSRILAEKALKMQEKRRVGEETVKVLTLLENSFEEQAQTLTTEVKRLQNIEERFFLLKKKFEETAQQRTTYLKADISNRERLENALQEFRILEAEKTNFENALETESTERQRLASQVNSLTEKVRTLTVQNERLVNEVQTLVSEVQTLSKQKEKSEDLINEFVWYKKTLVNGVVGLGVGGALDKNFVQTYLAILEKCKGGAK